MAPSLRPLFQVPERLKFQVTKSKLPTSQIITSSLRETVSPAKVFLDRHYSLEQFWSPTSKTLAFPNCTDCFKSPGQMNVAGGSKAVSWYLEFCVIKVDCWSITWESRSLAIILQQRSEAMKPCIPWQRSQMWIDYSLGQTQGLGDICSPRRNCYFLRLVLFLLFKTHAQMSLNATDILEGCLVLRNIC